MIILIDEGHDPVHDPAPLREYMDKWDGPAFIDELRLSGREDGCYLFFPDIYAYQGKIGSCEKGCGSS